MNCHAATLNKTSYFIINIEGERNKSMSMPNESRVIYTIILNDGDKMIQLDSSNLYVTPLGSRRSKSVVDLLNSNYNQTQSRSDAFDIKMEPSEMIQLDVAFV